ncbi:MAG: methylthioribulose 1-phosphate dehydratase [Polyangiales bacterium]|nr:methylthioribulose 1-phosphate dehydratase [Myxococcales bacterium]MCB9658007.1 methylthioribulose 1-phosphate dehydratase [Sandaracinaceae bacterium]
MQQTSPRRVITELSRQFYTQGWATGTGGGISVREGGRVFMAPSGVQKERIREEDIFELDMDGAIVSAPEDAALKVSECSSLFYNAFRMRDAGAVLHSHGMNAMLVTLLYRDVFECTEIEMIKGLAGHGYFDRVQVPIIDNTARECDLAERMAEAMEAYPASHAVLVRRHGVYVWGRDWAHAKTQAECYHYLFEAAVRMRQLGLEASVGEVHVRAVDAVGGVGGKR